MKSLRKKIDLSRHWPAKVGILFIVLGIGSLLSYAFHRDWLDLVWRFLLTLLLGISIATFGLFSMTRAQIQGHLLVALGSFISILSFWMGNAYFQLFSAESAFTGMLTLLLATALIALRFKNKKLALLTLLMAILPPFISQGPENLLLSYLFLVDSIAIFLFFRYWTWPAMTACIFTCAYFFLTAPSLSKNATFEIFLRFFFLLFYLPSLFLLTKREIQAFATALVLLSLVPFWGFICNFPVNSFFLMGAILLFPAYLLSRCSSTGFSNKIPSVILGIAIFSCATLGIQLGFKSSLLQNCALFIEVLAALLFTGGLFKSARGIEWTGCAFIIPIFQSLLHLDPPLFLVAIPVLAIAGGLLNLWKEPLLAAGLFSFSGLYALALVWVISHETFSNAEIARGAALTSYTAMGVIAITRNNSWLRTAGGLLLLGVVGRLLIFEVWHMSTLNKILTFSSSGVLLLLTAFPRKMAKEMQLEEHQNQKA
jgi:hypothetical protein